MTMQRLKLTFFRSLIFIVAVESFVLILGMYWMAKGTGNVQIAGLLLCFSCIPLAQNISWLLRFMGGRVFYLTTASIPMNGGKITFKDPQSPYEVWLFCKIPISRYEGKIFISNNSSTRSWTRDIPHSNPIMRSFRSDCTPIVLSPPYLECQDEEHTCININLRQFSGNVLFKEMFPVDEILPIVVMVKSI